jgi:hypothetical protein
MKVSISYRKPDFLLNIMNVKRVEVPAKLVPAAAVIRMGRVLFILTRRKGPLGGKLCFK